MYDLVAGMSWRVALSMSALDDACRAHPEFHVVDHEVLCRDPHAEYRKLFDAIGLDWSDEVESHNERANRPGAGYETNRIAGEQSGKWRERMAPDDACRRRDRTVPDREAVRPSTSERGVELL